METKYVNELKKDIKIIKKDLRSMNIKTRTIFKELEKNKFKITTIKKTPKSDKPWWKRIVNKLFGTKW
jgi:phage terminase large subunit-like protein